MIRPPGLDGVALSEASDGDLRADFEARRAMSESLGIDPEWATVQQVHGGAVVRVTGPGDAGEADALWTTVRRLPIAVFTADCFGVVLVAEGGVGVAHCGWPGANAGVVGALRSTMERAGHRPVKAVIGPGIGPCCFEVGPEVAELFEGHHAVTTWGTTSVDLPSVIAHQLGEVQAWSSGHCTHHEEGWFSHRRRGDGERLATLAWLP